MLGRQEFAQRGTLDRGQLDQIFSLAAVGSCLIACVGAPLAAGFCCRLRTFRRIAYCLNAGVLGLIGTTDFFCWIFKGAQRAAVVPPCSQVTSRAFLLGLSLLAVTGQTSHGVPGPSRTSRGRFYGGARACAFWPGPCTRFRWVRLPRAVFYGDLARHLQEGAILILSVIFYAGGPSLIVARFQGRRPGGALWGR